MCTSNGSSSSEGKQSEKRVTFGEPIVVGSLHSGVSGEGDGTIDSGDEVFGDGQNVLISGATDGLNSGEGSSGGESHSLMQSIAQLV